MLLQEVSADVNEGAAAAVVGEFVDEGFGLLDDAFEGGGRGLAEAYCETISLRYLPYL
jgi:hypothetical protein